MPASSYTEARATGAAKYFTGKPCKHGHIAERYVGRRTCVECHRIEGQARRATPKYIESRRKYMEGYSEKNRSKMQEYDRAWKAAFRRENPELCRDYRMDYTKKNLEKLRAYRRQYVASNREHLRAKERERDDRNREAVRLYNRQRSAMRKGASGRFTVEDIARIRSQQRDRCAACRNALKGKGTIDHILAITRGGANDPANLQLLCGPCNSSKGTRDAMAFMQERGFLL